jgi:hypothetical protein
MSTEEDEKPVKVRYRHFKTITKHVRQEWYKYVIQGSVVITGIIVAFTLEKWHLSQLETEQFMDAYELIAQEIKLDTVQMDKILVRFEKRKSTYQSIINNTFTREEFDSCYYCPRIVTSLYTMNSTDKGFQHLGKLSDYRIGKKKSLNNEIEEYYHEVSKSVPMWQKFIEDDIKNNIEYWKNNMSWYYQRESRPEDMIEYQFNSFRYKNKVYVQRNLIYKNYVPLLIELQLKARHILAMIEKKRNL